MRTAIELMLVTDSGREIPVSSLPCVIGRDENCHIRIQSDLISRTHCSISRSGTELILRDLGSTNGTFLNGNVVQGETVLLNGDSIKLGSIRLEIAIGSKPAVTEGRKTPANDTWPTPTNSASETRPYKPDDKKQTKPPPKPGRREE